MPPHPPLNTVFFFRFRSVPRKIFLKKGRRRFRVSAAFGSGEGGRLSLAVAASASNGHGVCGKPLGHLVTLIRLFTTSLAIKSVASFLLFFFLFFFSLEEPRGGGVSDGSMSRLRGTLARVLLCVAPRRR